MDARQKRLSLLFVVVVLVRRARRFRHPTAAWHFAGTRTGAAHRLSRPCSDRDALCNRGGSSGCRRQQLRRFSSGGEVAAASGSAARSRRRADSDAASGSRDHLWLSRQRGGPAGPCRHQDLQLQTRWRPGDRADSAGPGERDRRASQAGGKAREIEAQFDTVRAAVRGYARPRVLLVFGRQPQSLRQMYASGGAGFLNDILEAAGGRTSSPTSGRNRCNRRRRRCLRERPTSSSRFGREDQRATTDAAGEQSAWSPLASIPAVRNGRIHLLTGAQFVVPGPRVGLAAEQLARMLHPEAFK